MRTLSPILQSALTKTYTTPAVKVIIDDRHIGMLRPRWSLVTSDNAPDGPATLAPTHDGALIRARVNPSTGHLTATRVTDGQIAAAWAARQLDFSGVSATAQIAIAWDGYTILALFYVLADQRTIQVSESTDNGATWSFGATVTTLAAGHQCTSLAASLNSGSGTLYLFYTDETTANPIPNTTVYTTHRSEAGGAWSTPAGWGRTPVTNRGIAVDGNGAAFRVAACFGATLRLYTVTPAQLTAWPDPVDILRSDNTYTTYHHPSIAVNFAAVYYVFYSETNKRTTPATTRLCHIFTPDLQDLALHTRPYNITSAYGASCTLGDAAPYKHYLVTSNAVYSAPAWSGATNQRIDVSADVLQLKLNEALVAAGSLEILLRNEDGRYAADLGSTVYQTIRNGSQISVRAGYTVSGNDLVSYYRPYWITYLQHTREARRSHLVIHAEDGWAILKKTESPRSLSWTSHTTGELLRYLLAGLGFYVADDSSAAWSLNVPTFAVTPGTLLAEPITALLRIAGGQLVFQCSEEWEDSWPSAWAYLVVPSTTSTYTYGATHPIQAADYTAASQIATQVTTVGHGNLRGAALDFAAIEAQNQSRTDTHIDRRLTSQAGADAFASSLLATAQRQIARASITVAPNPAQEIGDTVTLQDDALGLSADYAVLANRITYDLKKAEYSQTLELGAPEWT